MQNGLPREIVRESEGGGRSGRSDDAFVAVEGKLPDADAAVPEAFRTVGGLGRPLAERAGGAHEAGELGMRFLDLFHFLAAAPPDLLLRQVAEPRRPFVV